MNMNTLEHKATAGRDLRTIAGEIDALAARLDQTHPLERKVRFLLDVRGYIKANQLAGSYIEFGSFRSEMQYAAWSVLDGTGMMRDYVGLDTFTGEPTLTDDDAAGPGFNVVGDFACDFDEIQRFVGETIGERGRLVRGDFRESAVLERCAGYGPFNIVAVDCNLRSSITAALDWALPRMVGGGVLFIDDYFADVTEGRLRTAELVDTALDKAGRCGVTHGFYPPFARSLVVTEVN